MKKSKSVKQVGKVTFVNKPDSSPELNTNDKLVGFKFSVTNVP